MKKRDMKTIHIPTECKIINKFAKERMTYDPYESNMNYTSYYADNELEFFKDIEKHIINGGIK